MVPGGCRKDPEVRISTRERGQTAVQTDTASPALDSGIHPLPIEEGRSAGQHPTPCKAICVQCELGVDLGTHVATFTCSPALNISIILSFNTY